MNFYVGILTLSLDNSLKLVVRINSNTAPPKQPTFHLNLLNVLEMPKWAHQYFSFHGTMPRIYQTFPCVKIFTSISDVIKKHQNVGVYNPRDLLEKILFKLRESTNNKIYGSTRSIIINISFGLQKHLRRFCGTFVTSSILFQFWHRNLFRSRPSAIFLHRKKAIGMIMLNKTLRGDAEDKRIAQTNWLILGFALKLMLFHLVSLHLKCRDQITV